MKLFILKGSLAILGTVSAGYIAFFMVTTDFPRFRAERLRDDCEKLYGKATEESGALHVGNFEQTTDGTESRRHKLHLPKSPLRGI